MDKKKLGAFAKQGQPYEPSDEEVAAAAKKYHTTETKARQIIAFAHGENASDVKITNG